MALLGVGGIYVNKIDFISKIGNNNFLAVLEKLVMRNEMKIGPPQVAHGYYETRGRDGVTYLHLPRNMIKSVSALMGGCRIVFGGAGNAEIVTCELTGKLFDNQIVLCNWVMENVFTEARAAAGTASLLLELEAGLGKTFVFAGIMARLRRRALYIVPNKFLQKQAVEDLSGTLGCRIGAVVGSSDKAKSAENFDVSVIVINTAMLMSEKYFSQFGFICLDEAHMYVGPKRRKIYWNAMARYVMMMSATINENRFGFDPLYHRQVNEIVHSEEIPGFDAGSERFKANIDVIHYCGHPDFTKEILSPSTGKLFTPSMIKQFAADPRRNELIIRETLRLWKDPTNNIFIFVENRDHADLLSAEIEKRLRGVGTGAGDKDVHVVIADDGIYEKIVALKSSEKAFPALKGGIKDAEREIALAARIIPVSYSYGGTGISIKKMNCAIFATSRRSNMRQITRRICRKGGDVTKVRQIIDIVDEKTAMRFQLASRLIAYRSFKWKISHRKITWEEIDETSVGEQNRDKIGSELGEDAKEEIEEMVDNVEIDGDEIEPSSWLADAVEDIFDIEF